MTAAGSHARRRTRFTSSASGYALARGEPGERVQQRGQVRVRTGDPDRLITATSIVALP